MDEALYNAWTKSNPTLVQVIAELIELGVTPEQFDQRNKLMGMNPVMAGHIRSIAEHLKRKQRT